jgi:outer membrane protein TolC
MLAEVDVRVSSAQQFGPPVFLPPGSATNVVRLTLEEAKGRALQNNRALGLAGLNIVASQHATAAAGKDYYPKLLGNVTYFHFDKDIGTVLTTPGVLAPAQTVPVSVLNQDSAISTVMLAQPITKLIAVNAAVQLARADEAIAQAQLEKGRQDLLSGVAQVYYGLLGAQRIRAALELQITLLEQVGGEKPTPDLRIGLLEARQGLLQVKGQSDELTQQLNNLLDLPACTILELVEPMPSEPVIGCADEAAQLALRSSAEVREAEQNVAKAHAALQVAKMEYLPDVDVFGGYANQSAADYIQDNIGYLGVTASYTFWDWGKRREVKSQRYTQIALAQQNLQVTADRVQLQARKAYGTFESAREAYRLAGEMVEARKDAEQGAGGPAAMAAKGATAKAELEYMQVEIVYRVAHAQLLGFIGQK